jgi:hypothetical protein
MTTNTAIAAGGAELLASWTRAAEPCTSSTRRWLSRKSDSGGPYAGDRRFMKPTAIRPRVSSTSRAGSPRERTLR